MPNYNEKYVNKVFVLEFEDNKEFCLPIATLQIKRRNGRFNHFGSEVITTDPYTFTVCLKKDLVAITKKWEKKYKIKENDSLPHERITRVRYKSIKELEESKEFVNFDFYNFFNSSLNSSFSEFKSKIKEGTIKGKEKIRINLSSSNLSIKKELSNEFYIIAAKEQKNPRYFIAVSHTNKGKGMLNNYPVDGNKNIKIDKFTKIKKFKTEEEAQEYIKDFFAEKKDSHYFYRYFQEDLKPLKIV